MSLLRILLMGALAVFALSGCSDDDNDISSPPPSIADEGNTGGDGSGDDGSGDDGSGDDGSGDGSGQGVADDGPVAFNQFVIDQFDRDPTADPVALNGVEFEFDNSDPQAFDELLGASEPDASESADQ